MTQHLAKQALRRRKYGNKPTELDGYRFASRAEARRYAELVILLKAGEIRDLEIHPHYDFQVNGQKIGRGYTADFAYIELVKGPNGADWPHHVTEEIKGYVTADWRLRRDLFLALYKDRTLLVNGEVVK